MNTDHSFKRGQCEQSGKSVTKHKEVIETKLSITFISGFLLPQLTSQVTTLNITET